MNEKVLLRWKECMMAKGLKNYISKIKVIVSGKNCGEVLSVRRVIEVTRYRVEGVVDRSIGTDQA